MPFMQGRGAISRTLQYLQQGQITLKKDVRIMLFAYNYDERRKTMHPHHQGLYNFVFWHVPQLKYKNPEVQMVTLKNLTPTPWIKTYFDGSDREILIDCDSRTREEIHDHINNILGLPETKTTDDIIIKQRNSANFGDEFDRQCICEVSGQMPCPGWQPLPRELTGKGRKLLRQQQQE